jgi:hypothetical protein
MFHVPVEKLPDLSTCGQLHMPGFKKRKRVMMIRIIPAMTMLALVCAWTGCASSSKEATPEPLDSVKQILRLHGLEGRSLGNRSEAARHAAVDREKLSLLFLDYTKEDPFLANLYVGFITGVLAGNQHVLQVTQRGSRAKVLAGNLSISMHLKDGAWRVSLAESVPAAVKARAKMEKLRVADNS